MTIAITAPKYNIVELPIGSVISVDGVEDFSSGSLKLYSADETYFESSWDITKDQSSQIGPYTSTKKFIVSSLSGNVLYQITNKPKNLNPLKESIVAMGAVVAPVPADTVLPGSSSSVQLTEGYVLNVAGTTSTVGTIQRLDSAGTVIQSWLIGSGKVPDIGPYNGTQQFIITCTSGTVSVSTQNSVFQVKKQNTKSLPVLVWIGDSTISYSNAQSGNATSLVYNGNGTATIAFSSDQGIRVGDLMTIQGAIDPKYNTSQPSTCILQVGNAYTYTINNPSMPTVSPDTGTSIVICYPLKGCAAGPIGITNNLTNKKLKHVNAGRNGDTLPQMLARFWSDVAVWNPDRVIYSGGINDVYGTGYSLDQIKGYLATLLQYCQQIGAKLDIITPFPQINTRSNWNTTKNTIFLQWCRYLPIFAAENNLVCESWGSSAAGAVQVQDPASATGNPTSTMYNADLVHPKNSATYCIAKRMAATYNTIYPTSGATGGKAVTEGGLFTNPTMIGSGGTSTNGTGTIAAGPVATGLTVQVTSGTATVTPYQTARNVISDGDIAGNWQGFSMVASAAGDQFTVTFPPLHTLVSNGDTVRVQTLARLTSGGNLTKELYFFCNSQTATTGNNLVTDMQLAPGQMAPYPENFSIRIGADVPVRGPSSIHGAPSAMQPTIRVTANAAGTIALEIACAFAEKL